MLKWGLPVKKKNNVKVLVKNVMMFYHVFKKVLISLPVAYSIVRSQKTLIQRTPHPVRLKLNSRKFVLLPTEKSRTSY